MVLKQKFNQYFENPLLFNIVRGALDGGNIPKIRSVLKKRRYKKILDVGCGTGKYLGMTNQEYVGIDNSPSFINYCKKQFQNEKRSFCLMDAMKMHFPKNSFDAAVIINTIHHLTDNQVITVLKHMARVSSRAVIILDAIPPKYNPISKFLYSLDRGAYFRDMSEQIELGKKTGKLKLEYYSKFKSTSQLYTHSLIVFRPL